MSVRVALILSFLLPAAALWGQTAAELENLLGRKEITWAEAAYFVLSSLPGKAPPAPEAAFALAGERNWLPKQAESGGPITGGGLSFLLMRAFEFEGGLMYRLFPGPRYAGREMTAAGLIEGPYYPTMKISGERFLRILGNTLSRVENSPEEQRRRLQYEGTFELDGARP